MMFTEINGTLSEGTLQSIRYKVENNGFVLTEYRFKHNEEIYTLPVEQRFYDSVEDFKRGVSLENKDISETRVFRGIMGIDSTRVWYFNNGKACAWEFYENVQTFEEISCDFKIIDGFIPKKYWYSKEDVYKWNDILVKRDDGTIEEQKGKYKVILLNKEQEALKNELETLLEKMALAGINILHDREHDNMYVINRDKSITIDYDREEEGLSCCYDLPKELLLKNRVYIYAYSEDCIFVE